MTYGEFQILHIRTAPHDGIFLPVGRYVGVANIVKNFARRSTGKGRFAQSAQRHPLQKIVRAQ